MTYALWLAMLLSGSYVRLWRDMLTLRTAFWIVRHRHTGKLHCALWRRGMGWACEDHPAWSKNKRHQRIAPVPFVIVALVSWVRR